MRISVLVAPVALKGTFGPVAVANAIAVGVRHVLPGASLHLLPLSDGGDGLLEALLPEGARRDRLTVPGPLGVPVEADIGWLSEREAVIESAAACGLRLVSPGELAPLVATTRGVGELLAAVTKRGARRAYVGLGGSATVDGGTGMARALGWAFLSDDGGELPDGGGSLERLASVSAGPPVHAEVIGLADVANPLIGARGAARTYGPQKGADPAAVAQLERGLAALARWAEGRGMGDVAGRAGAGAAGGLGAGLCYFAGGRLEPGAAWVLDRVGFDAALAGAACVLTAEGAFDATSLSGKATGEVVRRARAAGVPAGVIAGRASVRDRVPVFTPPTGLQLDAEGLAALARRAVAGLLGLPGP